MTKTERFEAAQKKENWPPGPWHSEPDRVHWIDPATGLDCLAVRGPIGAWCGYVGVPQGHPFFGRSYSQCLFGCAPEPKKPKTFYRDQLKAMDPKDPAWNLTALQAREEARAEAAGVTPFYDRFDHWDCTWDKDHPTLQGSLDVHGGVTFTGACEGDICHHPEDGPANEPVWWIGFDCAHSGDLAPRMAATNLIFFEIAKEEGDIAGQALWDPATGHHKADVYRDLTYVQAEVTALAKQLEGVVYDLS